MVVSHNWAMQIKGKCTEKRSHQTYGSSDSTSTPWSGSKCGGQGAGGFMIHVHPITIVFKQQ